MFFAVRANNKTKKVLVLDTDDLEIEWIPFNTMFNYMRKGLIVENLKNYYKDLESYSGFYTGSFDYYNYYQDLGKYGIEVDFPEQSFKNRLLVSEKYKAIFFLQADTWKIQLNNYYFVIHQRTEGKYASAKSYLEINGSEYQLKYDIDLHIVKDFGVDTHGNIQLTLGYEFDTSDFDIHISIYKDGTLSCRKLKLTKQVLGMYQDFSLAKRRFLLNRG